MISPQIVSSIGAPVLACGPRPANESLAGN